MGLEYNCQILYLDLELPDFYMSSNLFDIVTTYIRFLIDCGVLE